MRSASGAVRSLFAITLLVAGQIVIGLWLALPEIWDAGLAIYHAAAGICRHTFRTNQTGIVTLVALLVLSCGLVTLARFALRLVQLHRRTRARVEIVLAARIATWPDQIRPIASRLGLSEPLDVVDWPAPVAFTYGVLRPRICLSTGLVRLLGTAELEAVLLHEDHHRRRRDPLVLLVTSAVVDALFFIPTLRDLYARYSALKEFAADAAAVHHLGGVAPMAGALYKVLSCPMVGPDLRSLAVGGLSVTQRRIDQLLAPRGNHSPALSRPRLVVSAVTVSAAGVLILTIAAGSLQPILHVCRL